MLQSGSIWNDESDGSDLFNERRTGDGAVRPSWTQLSAGIERIGYNSLSDRSRAVQQLLSENGVTFHADATSDQVDRPWQLSVIPMVIPSDQWQIVSEGLAARTRLLEKVLADFLGPQQLIRDGIVPGELLWSNPSFYRAYHGLDPSTQKLHITATNLTRGSDGIWRVMSDRTRAPSGLGYLLENRIVTSRVMPSLIRQCNTVRLASFFESLRNHLYSLARSNHDNPRVAILTPPSGSYREFEDTYLARYLGITLVQGSDLAVRNGKLNLKTLGGLKPIEVLWRHVSDRRCDPLTLQPDSSEGVTGLVDCVRAQTVAVANSIGSVLVQTPALLPYLDAANQYFFATPLQLESVPTFWCGDPQHRKYVIDHMDSLRFADAFTVSGRPPIAPMNCRLSSATS